MKTHCIFYYILFFIFRDDEVTDYPETEYEDHSFSQVNNGGGLFSGKGAAKGKISKKKISVTFWEILKI